MTYDWHEINDSGKLSDKTEIFTLKQNTPIISDKKKLIYMNVIILWQYNSFCKQSLFTIVQYIALKCDNSHTLMTLL